MSKVSISKWGNSLAFRIPKHLLTAANIKENDLAYVEVIDGKIYITPVKPQDINNNFDTLARAYVEASDAVDDYDVHSEIPEQLEYFNKLVKERDTAKSKLYDFIKTYS